MMFTDMAGIKNNDIQVELFGDGSGITVRLEGSADTRVKDAIHGFLQKTHSLASEQHIPHVTIDFRRLEFMNSACFKAFVTWLGTVKGLDEGSQYRIRFLANDKIHWQRRSMRALRCFAASIVSIEN